MDAADVDGGGVARSNNDGGGGGGNNKWASDDDEDYEGSGDYDDEDYDDDDDVGNYDDGDDYGRAVDTSDDDYSVRFPRSVVGISFIISHFPRTVTTTARRTSTWRDPRQRPGRETTSTARTTTTTTTTITTEETTTITTTTTMTSKTEDPTRATPPPSSPSPALLQVRQRRSFWNPELGFQTILNMFFPAVVGGAVVGLLCAILCVMFVVYRMRKKDEGSYALDEPKRSPTVNSYSKPPSREFYA